MESSLQSSTNVELKNVHNGKNNVGKHTPHCIVEKMSHDYLHNIPKKNGGEPHNEYGKIRLLCENGKVTA